MNWMPYAKNLLMERQGIAPFCVSYAACNGYEVLKKSQGVGINLSDRYLAVQSETTLTGNSFSKVLSTFMYDGVVLESECGFPWLCRIFYKFFWSWIFNLSKVNPKAGRFKISGFCEIGTDSQALKEALNISPLLIMTDGYSPNTRHSVVGLNLYGDNMDKLDVFDSAIFKFWTLQLGVNKIFDAYTITC